MFQPLRPKPLLLLHRRHRLLRPTKQPIHPPSSTLRYLGRLGQGQQPVRSCRATVHCPKQRYNLFFLIPQNNRLRSKPHLLRLNRDHGAFRPGHNLLQPLERLQRLQRLQSRLIHRRQSRHRHRRSGRCPPHRSRSLPLLETAPRLSDVWDRRASG